MTITLHDFVMLGTTVPEPSKKDERVYVCSAGWHPDFGLIRIYPLARRAVPRRWSKSTVRVERNPQDSRRESWRIAGDRHDPNINEAFVQTGQVSRADRMDLSEWCRTKHVPTSIAEANDLKASLALVTPDAIDVELEHNIDSPDSPQLRLFDSPTAPPTSGAKRFPYVPRLRFHDTSDHRLMLRDWGAYEWMRKYPGREAEVAKALHLGPTSALLVGNLNSHRRAWVVISVLNVAVQQMTFDLADAS